jgi:hypothetical protein
VDQLVAAGCVIPRAVSSEPWPGAATLEVAHLWLRRGKWAGASVLNGQPTSGISSFLTQLDSISGYPYRLTANASKSFIGSYVLGMGFVLSPEEAQRLIRNDSRNKDVLFPYLNGDDLNSRPDQSPSRWVINFFDWPIERAMEYPDCFRIVEEKVKPERIRTKEGGTDYALRKPLPQKWWIYADKRPELYRTIAELRRVMVCVLVSKYNSFELIPAGFVYAHKLCVFGIDDFASLALLSSNLHEPWVRKYSSTLETRLNYSPTDCFETFPFPLEMSGLEQIGCQYHRHRKAVMSERKKGLTDTYNLFHDPDESSSDIQNLRDLHVEMDHAVAAVYGWTDLDLGHGFNETKQGVRFTISEAARREVLQRLLELNHERYAEEVKQGLHSKKKATKKAAPKKKPVSKSKKQAATLFDEDDDE